MGVSPGADRPRSISRKWRLARELVIQAQLCGIAQRPEGFNALSTADQIKVADSLRAQIIGRKDAAAAWFQKKKKWLLHPEESFEPRYRSTRHPRPTVRNLIYHVCPLTENDLWRKNVEQLVTRWHVFNGRRIVAVATGKGCQPPATVQAAFPPGTEFLILPNDPELREVVSFLPLLVSVAEIDEAQATFYGHTKGNSTDQVQGAVRWRNAAYHHLLDRPDECMEELETHAAVGIHKMIWGLANKPAPYPSGLQFGGWMLAGTFFWFRNDRVFTHPRWRNIPADRYGAEAWLSGMFHWSEAASVYQLWPEAMFPTPSPYDPELYPAEFDDE